MLTWPQRLCDLWRCLVLLGVLSLCCPTLALAADLNEALRFEGSVRHELATRISPRYELTKVKTLGYLAGKYAWTKQVRLQLAARAFYDAVYDLTDTFPAAVARDQEAEASLRQAQLDLSFGAFDAHVGLQQIVWGEAVGTFLADVVNPKDFREFVLPEFRDLRRPLWAVDLTYYLAPGLQLEGVWTPHLLFHKLARPGAEFAVFRPPPPPGVQVVTAPTRTPATTIGHSQGGLRLSWLTHGWDLSLFSFEAFDAFPTPFRRISSDTGQPLVTVSPRHTRLRYLGMTVGKTIEPIVLRSEIVATFDKFVRTTDPRDRDGVVRTTVLDYMLGVDYTLFDAVLVGVQFLQHLAPGATVRWRDELQRRGAFNTALSVRLEMSLLDQKLVPQVLGIVNTDRGDYRLSPKVVYHVSSALALTLGAHIFGGPRDTLYGQFDTKDVVYTEFLYTL